ncbi:MAG: sporulation transcriptional regulator SpoIIID [Firmicutes bacterium]|nr:sporulation transcriptional regulator SpoIIID [Bacillota bacterium]
MKDYIHKRVMDLSTYIIDRRATVRQAAKRFGVSNRTVHKDVTERLYGLNRNLAREVKRVLEANKAERHLRGGEATRRKYQTQAKSGTKKGGSAKKT